MVRLVRTYHDDYTAGVMELNGTEVRTIERPFVHTKEHRGGANNISCVPEGEYRLVPHNGGRYKNTFALVNPDLDVYHLPGDRPGGKGRFACVFHGGTVVSHSDGCPLLGLHIIDHRLHGSTKAMKILRKVEPDRIIITNGLQSWRAV